MGEMVDVAIVGKSTEWEQGYTWASFGDGIDILSFAVLSPSLATATISVEPCRTMSHPRRVPRAGFEARFEHG